MIVGVRFPINSSMKVPLLFIQGQLHTYEQSSSLMKTSAPFFYYYFYYILCFSVPHYFKVTEYQVRFLASIHCKNLQNSKESKQSVLES